MANGTKTQAQVEQAKISPAQRASLFAQMTRQNIQMLPAIAGSEGGTISFTVPKTRLLSKIRLLVEATLTATHSSSTSYAPADFAPFTLLKNVRVSINNGFNPFQVSGKGLYFYNLLRDNAHILEAKTSGRGKVVQGLTASSGGTANAVRFVADLPLTLNDRDPIGLVLAQNEETVITVYVDIGTKNDIAPAVSGYTFALSNISVTPILETFSIPAIAQAYPDLSILKLVQEQVESVTATGTKTIKLPVGNTYRKLIVFIEDASGGEADSDLSGNLELLFNVVDTPYAIKPSVLAAINAEYYGYELPQGLYVFDFTYQGLANYGGARDYIDTERLTEFWFRFNAAASGTVTLVSETLAQLHV